MEDDGIRCRFICQSLGRNVGFKINHTSCLSSAMNWFCYMMKKDMEEMLFVYKTQILSGFETPSCLNMQHEDIVEVFVRAITQESHAEPEIKVGGRGASSAANTKTGDHASKTVKTERKSEGSSKYGKAKHTSSRCINNAATQTGGWTQGTPAKQSHISH